MAPQTWESYRAPLSIQLVADAQTSSQGGGDDDAGDDGDDKDDGAGDDDEDDDGGVDDGNGNGGIGDGDNGGGGGGPMMLMMMTGHVRGWRSGCSVMVMRLDVAHANENSRSPPVMVSY